MARMLLLSILLVASLLRLYGLENTGLSFDEIGQVLVGINTPLWRTALDSAQHAASAPLDYVITDLVTKIGRSDGILRLPAVGFSVASGFVLYLLGRELFGEATGLLAAALLAVAPLHIFYAQVVRFYSLATFLILLSTYLLARAVHSNDRRVWIAYSAVTALALYSHYYMLIALVAHGLWTLIFFRPYLLPFVASGSVAVLLFVPWIWYDNIVLDTRGLRLAGNLEITGGITKLLAAPFVNVETATRARLEPLTWWWIGVMWTSAVGLLLLLHNHPKAITLLLLIVAIGFPVVLALDYLGRYPFATRQWMVFSPYLLLASAAAVVLSATSIRWSYTVPVAAVSLVLFSIVGVHKPLQKIYQPRPYIREAAFFFQSNVKIDDVLIVGYPEHISWYAPPLKEQIIQPNLHDMEGSMPSLDGYERIWVWPWMPGYRPALEAWAKENAMQRMYPIPEFPIYVSGN